MNIQRRLEKLEERRCDTGDEITAIIREIVAPSEQGPESLGIGSVSIIGGGNYVRKDYPDDETYKSVLDAAHSEIHGTPMDWDGTEQFH